MMRSIILVVLLAVPTFASAQSLADVARKERERQKQLKSVVVVNQGMTTTTAAGTSGTAAASPKQPAVMPYEVKDNNGHNEKYWRDRFQKARDDAKRAGDRVQLLDTKLRELNTALLTRSDIYNREYRLSPEIQDTQKQLDDARKAAEDARQKISDLEDELHKAGGPPGWAR